MTRAKPCSDRCRTELDRWEVGAGAKFVGRLPALGVYNGVEPTDRSREWSNQPPIAWSPAARCGAEKAVLRIMRRRYPGRRIVIHWHERDAGGEVPPAGLDVDRRKDAA